MRSLLVLGATGSVGRSTLDVAGRHPDQLRISGLSAHTDDAGLFDLCRQHAVPSAAMADLEAAERLRDRARVEGLELEVLGGADGVAELAARSDSDTVMAAIVGAAGLGSTMAAVCAGKRVLLATKEALVMSGALFISAVREHGAELIPIDSEHNAIFQCLPTGATCGERPEGVRRIILTASGGPFWNWTQERIAQATPDQAVAHPNWTMGRKISVDSATMMNKGLEVIEAGWLFGLTADEIDVVIHPQSTVHSLVEYRDGSVLAQLGAPDMRIPIAHALAAPERWDSGAETLDLAALGRLDFEAPDAERFPSLRLAREAWSLGAPGPTVLNAANESAVDAFLDGRLSFTGIAETVAQTLDDFAGQASRALASLEDVLAVDTWARCAAKNLIEAHNA